MRGSLELANLLKLQSLTPPPPNTHTSILTSSKKASPLILPKQFHPLEIKYSNMRAYEGHSYPNTTVVECTLFGPNWVIGL